MSRVVQDHVLSGLVEGTVTLEEYRRLTDAELLAMNDEEYGIVGGWGPIYEDPPVWHG